MLSSKVGVSVKKCVLMYTGEEIVSVIFCHKGSTDFIIKFNNY